MRAAYDNKVDDYTPAVSSEDANYPATNVKDTSLSRVWRSTGCAAEAIEIDVGTGNTITCTVVAIAGHNISGSATVVIAAGSSSTAIASSPSLLQVVTWRSGIMLSYFNSITDRIWRVYVLDPTNPDGYVEMGRLFFGTYLQFSPSSLREFPVKHVRSDGVAISISGQVFGDVGIEHREISYDFPRTTNAQKVLVEALWDECGKYKPFFFSNFDTNFEIISPLYCVIFEDLTFKFLSGSEWEYNLSLREVG